MSRKTSYLSKWEKDYQWLTSVKKKKMTSIVPVANYVWKVFELMVVAFSKLKVMRTLKVIKVMFSLIHRLGLIF